MVTIHKIVAASSPGGKWLPCRGNIMDLNRENSTPNHPVLNQTASYLEVAGTNPVSADFFYNNVNSRILYGGKRMVSAVLVDKVIGLIVKKTMSASI